jgi:4-amino-4-deoxy-L-arabinose transferase-like glycosyltransferase
MMQRFPTVVHVALLVLLCAVLYFPYLGAAPFYDKGEPREAMAVQDIVRRGEWLVPLKRATDVPSKPPLFHWTAAAAFHATGELDEATIRFPSALYATLGVVLLYFLARKLFNAETALCAGAILATTLVYQDQALDARVDMTLCFFVILSLSLFYALCEGLLTRPVWYYVFFAVTGIGALAKGPLGIVLPTLVAGSFVVLGRRWDRLAKFVLHPGVLLMLALAAGWYVVAVTRGGEGFFDRQIIQENLSRFAGGSGHSHPVYYYFPYLFSQALPWGLLLPIVLWDTFRRKSSSDAMFFLKVWFVVLFLFFSVSLGKRPVYLLPLYPALAMLLAHWLVRKDGSDAVTLYYCRAVALLAGFTGGIVLLVVVGDLWDRDPMLLFGPVERLLKPKDRANFTVIKDALTAFGWPFTLAALTSALLWLSLARCLWNRRLLATVPRFLAIAVIVAFVGRSLVVPTMAEARSYRSFMLEVDRLLSPQEKLYLYGKSFNSDPVVFYHGEPLDSLDLPPAELAARIGRGSSYVIMAERDWRELLKLEAELPPPMLKSAGTGPEGDAPLVLARAAL